MSNPHNANIIDQADKLFAEKKYHQAAQIYQIAIKNNFPER
jgi:hypothetical protein